MSTPWDTLKTLSDPTRLRLLALLRREELAVAELQDILEMGQSRISTHLSLLRQAGLVADRREGKKSFYSIRGTLPEGSAAIVEASCRAIESTEEARRDAANLDRVLARRRQVTEQYFNLLAGRLGRHYCPGRSWEAIGRMLLRLVPAVEVADLGAGEGVISQLLARRARHVWCVDNSPRMVEVGSELAARNGLANLTYRLGDIEKVPLPEGSVDVALLSQALHHAPHPQQAVNEAFRILRPGGLLLVLDLLEHSFEKARELYADHWLGFSEGTLHEFLRRAQFQQVEVLRVAREPEPPHFTTLLAAGNKPG